MKTWIDVSKNKKKNGINKRERRRKSKQERLE